MMAYLRHKAGISLASQTFTSGISFAVGIYLAYRMGVSSFGQYSLILLITQFCIEIQRSLITAPMFVFINQKNNKEYTDDLYVLQLVLGLVLSFLSTVFIYITGYWFTKWQISQFSVISGILVFVRLNQEFYRRYFFAVQRPVVSLKIDIACNLLLVAGFALCEFYQEVGIRNIMLVNGLSAFIPLLLVLRKFSFNLRSVTDTAKLHGHFGKWLLASSSANYLSSNLLLFIGSAVIGTSAAGIMKLSQYIMGGMIVIYQAAENIVPQQLSSLVNQGSTDDLKSFLIKYLGVIFMITIIHGLMVYCLLDKILYHINGKPYSYEQYTIALGYILFSFLLTANYSLQYLLRALKETRMIFIASIVSVMATILAGKALVINYQATGILYGFFLCQLIALVTYISYFFINRYPKHENHPYPVG